MNNKCGVTVQLPKELINRVRNIVYAHSPEMTVNKFFENTIQIAVESFEDKNNGHYPERKGDLAKGPRVS